MHFTSLRLSKTLLFAAILSIFGLLEYSVWYQFSYPDHAVPRRHRITPDFRLENKLFAEFDGSAKLLIPVDPKVIDASHIQGIQIKTGTYGQRIGAKQAEIVTEQGQTVCKSAHKFIILENQWTSVLLTCESSKATVASPLYLQIELAGNEHWAVYQFAGKHPAIQIWFSDPAENTSFFKARNYGSLWSPIILWGFRILSRVAISLGIVWMIFHRRERRSRRFMLAGLLIWCGLFWGQFFETVSYHNSDETMHVAGAVRQVTGENWTAANFQLRVVAAKVQFYETFARSGYPIVAGHSGGEWISADNYFVNPESRSALYNMIVAPMTRATLALSSVLEVICSDPVTLLRAFLSLTITALVFIASWFYIRSGRFFGFWILLVLISVPAVLASLLTIWNYGLLTILGTIFCVNLLPQTGSRSNFKYFVFSSALIPILAELARSQVLWFVIGPLLITAAWIYTTSKDSTYTTSSKLIGMIWFALSSTAIYCLLIFAFGDGFIPDRGGVYAFLTAFSNRLYMLRAFIAEAPLTALGGIHIAVWILSGAVFLLLNEMLNYLEKHALPEKRWVRVVWSACISAAIFIVIFKCLSIHDVTILGSLAEASPYPTFSAYFKEAYRALMSQTFSRYQDYFLIQTFFMAYGWLEVTGHWFVYFIYRHLVEIGFITVLFASIRDTRAFFQLYLPSWIAFAIYFISIFYGTWHGHFTIIGRLVFPAIGLLFCPMLLALRRDSRQDFGYSRDHQLQTVVEVLFFYMVINAIYGAFYLLPLRFVVGI